MVETELTDGGAANSRAAGPLAEESARPLRWLAKLVTETCAPAVVVTVMLIVIAWHAYDYTLRGVWWGLLAALFASLIPFGIVLRAVRVGRLTDHHIVRREQRRGPLLMGLCCMAVGTALLVLLGVHRDLLASLGAGAAGLLVSLVINHWWKMSIHCGVAAGSVVMLAETFGLTKTFGPFVLVSACLVPLIAWSRVYLRVHTLAQTVAGTVIGAVVAGVGFAALR